MIKATINSSNSSHDHINGNIATIINTTDITTNTWYGSSDRNSNHNT